MANMIQNCILRAVNSAEEYHFYTVRGGGSNPPLPTRGLSSFGRAMALQAIGDGFDPRSLHHDYISWSHSLMDEKYIKALEKRINVLENKVKELESQRPTPVVWKNYVGNWKDHSIG